MKAFHFHWTNNPEMSAWTFHLSFLLTFLFFTRLVFSNLERCVSGLSRQLHVTLILLATDIKSKHVSPCLINMLTTCSQCSTLERASRRLLNAYFPGKLSSQTSSKVFFFYVCVPARTAPIYSLSILWISGVYVTTCVFNTHTHIQTNK